MRSEEIRQAFLDYFASRGHQVVKSSPLVPEDDPTLLFTNAGMVQFKRVFLQQERRPYTRATSCQKCLRAGGKHNDLENVGRTARHHTFFEMLGNFSFGDYFKREAIQMAWELLTEGFRLPKERLWVSVHYRDEEAKRLWLEIAGLPEERIVPLGDEDNFWAMGETGPCGPCSEIIIDQGEEVGCGEPTCGVGCDCDRYLELWNLVFMQFERTEDGRLQPLPKPCIDTGMGLERIAAVLQGAKSNYDTDLFSDVIARIEEASGLRYGEDQRKDVSIRVVADHSRAIAFLIADGVLPSNEGRGYVIRRILRRASRFGRELGMREPFIHTLVPVVAGYLGDAFGEIRQRADYVSTVIESEEASFGKTLDRGIEIFNGAAKRAQKSKDKTIDGEDAFQLYDTYGFPLDLTELMAEERSLKVDSTRFAELMDQQRQRARAASAKDSLSIMDKVSGQVLPETEDLHKYEADQCDAVIAGVIDENGFRSEGRVEAGAEIGIVLDRTCFYAEAGGQVGDCGVIRTDTAEFIVDNTTKIANCIVHQGKVAKGAFEVGGAVRAVVSKDRNSIKKNHTATHLLQWALQQVLLRKIL